MALKQINEKIFKFTKKGEKLSGVITGTSDHIFEGSQNPCKVYHMKTDDNQRLSFICGTPTDMALQYRDLTGMNLTFEYDGKQEIANGRSMNVFNVYENEIEGDINGNDKKNSTGKNSTVDGSY
jgi:hypothetical protein